MIALLTGKIAFKGGSHVVVDASGVGYRVFIPLTTFYELPEAGQAVTLHIFTSVKEDAIHLFGFISQLERELFEMMISVSGIGPKLALGMLSGISPRDMMEAISCGNLAKLVTVPGVGKKMAERLVLELRDKMVKKMASENFATPEVGQHTTEDILDDALSALVNLGYKQGSAKSAIEKAAGECGPTPSMDQLLKTALKLLAG